jgi:putative transposase
MVSTRYLYDNCLDYLRQFYWKNKRVLWTHGYFCSTIGDMSKETVKHYIENQG